MNSLEIIKLINKMTNNTRIIKTSINVKALKKGLIIDKITKK